ncbi:MAG: septum site-determining protein MinC [bacterium]|nr:septum site-determining protein MinC [bacterium]
MRDQLVTIKGNKDGLLVQVSPTEEWNSVTADLAARIDQQASFYAGARVTLDVGARPVRKDELGSVKALLERRGLSLWSVSTESRTTIDSALALDLRTSFTKNAAPMQTDDMSAPTSQEDGTDGILIKRTLRSGRSIKHQGHVVVLGDVNAGAEVIAGGDVIIWGRLRGNVHAGANGDDTAVVCALDMTPTQLRIAAQIAIAPTDKRHKARPEMALIRNNRIIVENWE